MGNRSYGVQFLRGKKVVLRPPNKETDLKLFHKWMNDPSLLRYLSAYLPISPKKGAAWFDRIADEKNDNIVLAIETLKGELVGYTNIHNIDWKDRVATVGSFIGYSWRRGGGLGADAQMLLLHYAFHSLNLRKICSRVIKYNERSKRHLKKCGYREEGVLKRHIFKEGEYRDMILMAVFREDWEPLWEEYRKDL